MSFESQLQHKMVGKKMLAVPSATQNMEISRRKNPFSGWAWNPGTIQALASFGFPCGDELFAELKR